MKFMKGIMIGGLITTGLVMMYSEGMMNKKVMMKKGKKMAKKESMAICTLLGAFLIHAIIGVFHTRSKTYIYSYLSEISIVKFYYLS